jgi:AraC-like DNA-binding protein
VLKSEWLSSLAIVELLTQLVIGAQNEEMPNTIVPTYIEAVLRELDQQFSSKITLDQLATQFALSKFHLAKQFKRYIGISPGKYLINRRMTVAKELLKYSDKSIAEIANQVGIENVTHFINLIKARVEETPFVFRKKWQRPRSN